MGQKRTTGPEASLYPFFDETRRLTLMASSQQHATYRTAATVSRTIHFFAHPKAHEVVVAFVGDSPMEEVRVQDAKLVRLQNIRANVT